MPTLQGISNLHTALQDLPTMVQLIISRLARSRGEVLGWNCSFSSLVLASLARANMEIFRGICHLFQREIGLYLSLFALWGLSSQISSTLYLAWARIPSICCPLIGWDLGFLDVLAHASKQKALRSSHRLCSGHALCDMLFGRLYLWQGATRAAKRALGMMISYFGQEPNPLSTYSTHILWEFAPCTIWPLYMARQCRPSFQPACHENKWCSCTVKHDRKIKMRRVWLVHQITSVALEKIKNLRRPNTSGRR